ncbi:MAG: helix-turn-helix domain-containing protein [Candidatus Limnocylindrales bacterium]
MSESPAEILLHPVRLRIVLAFGSERLTTAQLADRLPDIAHATLYRQVAALAEAGMLEVVAERQVRGGVERTYALAPDGGRLSPDVAAEMTPDELLRGFVVFAGTLVDSVGRYLEHPSADPAHDPFSFRQAALWLDDDERADLIERLRAAIAPYLANGPSAERERLLLNTVVVPDRSSTGQAED